MPCSSGILTAPGTCRSNRPLSVAMVSMALIAQASRFGKQAYAHEVFCMTGAWDDQNPTESVWLMSFYKRFTAMTVTAPPAKRVMMFADKRPGPRSPASTSRST
jgi:hypothetical protein